MFELTLSLFWLIWDFASPVAIDAWVIWAKDPKLLCYAGLFVLYFAGYLGAGHQTLYGFGALFYLLLFLAQI